jgi:hypothetical protein
MDAERRSDVIDGLASRGRISKISLGSLLRAHDDLFAGHGGAGASDSVGDMERMDATDS